MIGSPPPEQQREKMSDGAEAQRAASRRLSLEERFRENDSISRFRVEALLSQQDSE